MDWSQRRVVDLIAQAAEEVYEFNHDAGVVIATVSGVTTRSTGTARTSRTAWCSGATGVRWATRRVVRALQLVMVVIAGRVRFIIGAVIAIAVVSFIDGENALGSRSWSLQRVVMILAPVIGNSLVGGEQVQSRGV